MGTLRDKMETRQKRNQNFKLKLKEDGMKKMKTMIPVMAMALVGWTSGLHAADAYATDLKNPIINANIPVTADKPSWKPGDPIAFANGRVTFDVQNRFRMEMRNNNFDFNDSRNHKTDDVYFHQRFRLGVLVKVNEWAKIYAQGQDAREIDSDRQDEPFIFGAEGDDTFDLYQGYLDVGNVEKFPLTGRFGRQVLSYGDERLIGGFDWNNLGRTFDAMKLQYTHANSKTTVDWFMGNVVTVEGYENGSTDRFAFNESDSRDLFTGVYASSKIISFQKTEAYVLYRDKTRNNPEYRTAGGAVNTPYDIDQEVLTIGGRVQSTSTGRLKGFDYEFEGAYQTGEVGSIQGTATLNPAASGAQDLSAFATHAQGGYNWELAPWTPRFGVEYNYASGDGDSTDGRSGTFMNLFHTNHKFYGYMDVVSWKNIHNFAYTVSAKPSTKITLKMDHHFFWLADTSDALYRANGVSQVRAANANARNANSYVGHEVDLTATYAYSKWLNFLVGYSHFFAGDYLQQTQNTAVSSASATNPSSNGAPTPAGDDADFFYVQSVLKF